MRDSGWREGGDREQGGVGFFLGSVQLSLTWLNHQGEGLSGPTKEALLPERSSYLQSNCDSDKSFTLRKVQLDT